MGHPDIRVLCSDGNLCVYATLSAEAAGCGVLKHTPEQQAAFVKSCPKPLHRFKAAGFEWA